MKGHGQLGRGVLLFRPLLVSVTAAKAPDMSMAVEVAAEEEPRANESFPIDLVGASEYPLDQLLRSSTSK